MASLIGSLFVSLTADFGSFQRNMRTAEGTVTSTTSGMRRQLGLTEKSIVSMQRSFNSGIRPGALIAASRTFESVQQRANLLRGALFATTAAFGGLGAALTSNVISRYIDTFTSLENQIRVVSKSQADLNAQIGAVGDVADRTRSSLSATATLYSRLAKAQPGIAPEKTLRRVETINKALQLGGATAQEAASAAIQFSQAIASNRLGGEELRAVLETPLGLALAKGLGVTIGKLREMSIAGELTADVVTGALDRISTSVDRDFAKSVSTIDQALTQVDNKLALFAGRMDDTYGVSKILTGALVSFGDNLEWILPLVGQLAVGLGSAFAGKTVGGFADRRINAIKTQIDLRKDELRIANEEYALAKKAHEEAEAAARAARAAPSGGVAALAPKSAFSNLAREQAALTKLDNERIALTERQIELRQQLGQVTTNTTVGAVRAADSVLKAEQKLLDLQNQKAALTRRESELQKRLQRPGGFETYPKTMANAQSEYLRVINERANIFQKIREQEEIVAKRSIALTQLQTAAERKAADERLQIRRKLIAADQQQALLGVRVDAQRARVTGAGEGVVAAGGAVQAENVRAAARSAEVAALSFSKAEASMVSATRAAAGWRIGLGLVQSSVGSLVGFLGGPWGVAFTTAIGLMTYFGLEAQASAQKIAEAQAIIRDELGQGLASDMSEGEKKTLLEGRIIEETDRLAKVTEEMQRVRGEIAETLQGSLFTSDEFLNKIVQQADPQKALADLNRLLDGVRNGTVPVKDLQAALAKIGVDDAGINKMIADLARSENGADAARYAIERIQKRIKELENSQIKIKVTLEDPTGLLALQDKRERNQGDIKLNPLNPLTGLPPDIVAGQVDAFQKELRGERVNSYDHQLDTLTKSLFEAGRAFGQTMDQAEAMARQLLALQGITSNLAVAFETLKGVPPDLVRDPFTGQIGKGLDMTDQELPRLGTLTGVPNDLDSERRQRAGYGAGQEAARRQAAIDDARRRSLENAGEPDKVLNTPQKIRDRTQALLEEHAALGLTRREAEAWATQELDLAEKTRLAGQSSKKAADETLNFRNKIAELKETARGAFLSDLDQQVLGQADNLKNGAALMRQYVDAINSGDLSKAPDELLQIRESLMQIGAADTWRDIVQQYGTAAQRAQMFADKQAELNYLVAEGRITAGQAGVAFADFLGTFADYGWINDFTDALGGFLESAILDFENIEDAAASLLKTIAKIVLQYTLIEPLKQSLAGLFGGSIAGGFDGKKSSSGGVASLGAQLLSAVAEGVGKSSGGGSLGATLQNAVTAGVENVGKSSGGGVAGQIFDFFTGKGLKDFQAAAFVGHAKAESNFNPLAVGDAGQAFGLFQWNDRKGSLFNSIGGKGNLGDVQKQLEFAWKELQGSESRAFNNLMKSTNVRQATNAISGFERAKGWTAENPEGIHNFSGRLKGAESALSTMEGRASGAAVNVNTLSRASESATDAVHTMSNGMNSFGENLSKMTFPSAPGGGGGGFLSKLFGGFGSNISWDSLSSVAQNAIIMGPGGLYHEGGVAGSSQRFRMADFSHAPRFHNGLRSNELTAILEEGEYVLRANDGERMASTMRGLTALARGGGGSTGGGEGGGSGDRAIHVHVDGANGDEHVIQLVRQGVTIGLTEYDREFVPKAQAAYLQGRQDGNVR